MGSRCHEDEDGKQSAVQSWIHKAALAAIYRFHLGMDKLAVLEGFIAKHYAEAQEAEGLHNWQESYRNPQQPQAQSAEELCQRCGYTKTAHRWMDGKLAQPHPFVAKEEWHA